MSRLTESNNRFQARIEIIGINPYVLVPEAILKLLFEQAGRNKSPIPIAGQINGKRYQQTLMRYKGEWRLYINTKMLANSPKRVGETVELTIAVDTDDRTIKIHPELQKALDENKAAKEVFNNLSPSLKNEIVRYISRLKTDQSISTNCQRAIDFLLGKGRFVGREL